MSIRNLIEVLLIVATGTTVMQGSAFAGYRDGAFAAGMIGAAIGTAILMQGQRQQPAYHSYRRHVKSSKPSMTTGAATASKDDPFAGASAPADYAKPIGAHAQ